MQGRKGSLMRRPMTICHLKDELQSLFGTKRRKPPLKTIIWWISAF